jgi:maltose alpha-D-glucosyltransferase/alpha-amylase
MQWTDEQHGGFSKNKEINVPVITTGRFSYKNVNVNAQKRNRVSLLNWFERAIAARKECVEFGLGDYQVLRTTNQAVVAWCCYHEDGYTIAVHNFSNKPITVILTLKTAFTEHLIECFSDRIYKRGFSKRLSINAYGYRWFRKNPLFT